MKLSKRLVLLTLLLLYCWSVHARETRCRKFKIQMDIPKQMLEIPYVSEPNNDKLYYDTVSSIILMISKRETRFKSVNEYIDCSKKELESFLRDCYGDSSLTLTNCARSLYYPEKSTVISFHVAKLPFGMDTYTIYFIHHRGKDIQISFTYKQVNTKNSLDYIDKMMQTLKLN